MQLANWIALPACLLTYLPYSYNFSIVAANEDTWLILLGLHGTEI